MRLPVKAERTEKKHTDLMLNTLVLSHSGTENEVLDFLNWL